MSFDQDAMQMLEATSRTFYIPISRLPLTLKQAVGSAYLCLRSIDEIEDHPQLENAHKAELLHAVGVNLQSQIGGDGGGQWQKVFAPYRSALAPVTLQIGDWIALAPADIAPRVCDATAAMADRMAYWATNGWTVRGEEDLDRYTFSVAGAVGLLLSDLWAWYDGTRTSRVYAVGFGRGLQSVNIIRNRRDDLARGVDFFPDHWSAEHIHQYARRNLALADSYLRQLPPGPAYDFCSIPLSLAYATLDALARGEPKLTRHAVHQVVEQATRARPGA